MGILSMKTSLTRTRLPGTREQCQSSILRMAMSTMGMSTRMANHTELANTPVPIGLGMMANFVTGKGKG